MPLERPGNIKYVTNATGGALTHNRPVVHNNFVGVAIKQKAVDPTAALSTAQQIANGEDFAIQVKGQVTVPNTGITGVAKGDAVYIVAATQALTTTASGNVKYGRVATLPGQRGTPTGFVVIDLDAKDSF